MSKKKADPVYIATEAWKMSRKLCLLWE